MKPIVLLDIDDTLLSSRKLGVLTGAHFRKKFDQIVSSLGERNWRRTWTLARPELQGLSYALFGAPAGFLQSSSARASFLNPRYYRQALFADVIPTLKKMAGKVSLGVFSQGLIHWQFAKLYLGGIEKYFEREILFIFPPRKIDKAREVLAQLSPKAKIYFVDDRSDIAEALSNHRVKVLLIRRTPRPLSGNGRVIQIKSLREITGFF